MTSGWRLSAAAVAASLCVLTLPMLAPGSSDDDTKPNGKGIGTLLNPGKGNGGEAKPVRPGGGANGISYHGGPVMLGPVNLYYIWYGNWSGNAAVGILTTFGQSLGGSPYYNINTTYYNGSSTPLTNAINLVKTATDNYSQGTSLSDSAIQTVVLAAISSGTLPADTNGIYIVLTSADVTASSGFCSKYCGWHTYTSTSSFGRIKYAFVGDPTRCPSACQAQTPGPNGNSGADGMASIIAHEVEEAASDPELNAWYDSRGAENADKCAWTFGTTYTAKNGAKANMSLGSLDFLIQQNWVNATGGYCALQYP
ncbi:MAG: hypothetical protein JWO19_1177 [Bryobacterales bacterium]|jgi:hypothetical protein|nr:hypothetical protein [Bryobacterales bacterium]